MGDLGRTGTGTRPDVGVISQPGSSMFERNVAHLAKKEREIKIVVYPANQEYVGFIAGLDEEYLQICKTESQTLALVDRPSIISLEETGRSTYLFVQDPAHGVSVEEVEQIRRKCEHFVKVATSSFPRRSH